MAAFSTLFNKYIHSKKKALIASISPNKMKGKQITPPLVQFFSDLKKFPHNVPAMSQSCFSLKAGQW